MKKSSLVRAGRAVFGLKAKAILAGALVLGVGGAVTLASWNDSEVAAGAFTGGAFNLQSSLNGTAWADTTAAAPAVLNFTTAANTLSPNSTVYAPFAVQLATGTTNQAQVSIASAGTASNATTTIDAAVLANLTFKVLKSTSMTCDATVAAAAVTTPANVLLTGTGTTAASAANAITLAKAATPSYVCVVVTTGANLPQSAAGKLTWTFNAVSNDTLVLP